MKVLFVGAYYYDGPVHHLFRIFTIYKAIGDTLEKIGMDVRYFVKNNDVIPLHKTIKEQDLFSALETTDLVFIWNGAQSEHIVDKCRDQGTPVYFSELGWLPQNGTFYFDLKGVNYNSSILDWKYSEISQTDRQDLAVKIAYYHNILSKKTGIHEDNYVFVPFQVENDSQIIKYSPRIKTMQRLVDYVCAYVPGNIIFKAHPKHNVGEVKYPARCKLYRSGTTHDFLPNCKYVVTINSTVGVEALSYYKPVITLGNAFYEGRSLTYPAKSDEQFKEAVKWAEEGRAAKGVIESFLSYLFKRQWYMSYLQDPTRIFGLIEGVTNLE